MTSCDEKYEKFLSLIFPSKYYPDVHETLQKFEWKKTKYHNESFRSHCVVTGELMQKICKEKDLLQDTWNGITYAQLVGFLHDIGKPFVLKTSKNGHEHYIGHAQVGARLFYLRFRHEIPEPTLLRMGIAIDSHMCSLRSDKSSAVNILRINAVMNLYLPPLDIVPVLECLHQADALGKIPPITDENPTYKLESPISYRKNDKIVIFMIGPSGSGKSTLATKLQSLLSIYGSVQHLERDKVLMQFALKGESYKECRHRVYNDPDLKKQFQQHWTRTLYSADAKILLIDTLQNYYHMDAQQFYHHFRIGLYLVPINFFNSSLHGKAPKIEFPPEKWFGYPKVLTELKEEPWQLEVGTGIWQVIPTLVKRYLDQCVELPLEQQPTIASLWDKYAGTEAIKAQYNIKGITFSEQYKLKDDNAIIRVSYLALTDVTYGPTRYYRGEFLLKTVEGVSMLRSGFPTFRKKLDIADEFDKIVVTPKYDGSLVNLLHVPKQYKYYELLKEQFPNAYYPNYGLIFVGSKQTLMMEPFLRKRFDKAIGMEFEAFLCQYAHYLQDKMITLHFEMMVEQNSDELTVYYPKNFCKFLGSTTFTDMTRSFALPKPTDLRAVEQHEFDNLLDCERYIEQQHQRLLKGDLVCEPEGFVLFVYQNGLKDIVKRKFMEYLAAHKPQYHPEEYQKILDNPLLRDRFQKCREVGKDVKDKIIALTENLNQELTDSVISDRKAFALHLKSNRDKFKGYQREMNEITKNLRMKPIMIENNLWFNFPDKDSMVKKMFQPLRRFLEQ